jgi:hypothetical protein
MDNGNNEGNKQYGLRNHKHNNCAAEEEEDYKEQGPEEEDNEGEGGRCLQQRCHVDEKYNVDPEEDLDNDNFEEPREMNFNKPGRNSRAADNQGRGHIQGQGASGLKGGDGNNQGCDGGGCGGAHQGPAAAACWYIAIDTLSTLGLLFSFTSPLVDHLGVLGGEETSGYKPFCCLAFGSAAEL